MKITGKGERVQSYRDERGGIEDIYLPQCLGIRPCYARYMDSIGLQYKPTGGTDGKYEVVLKEGETVKRDFVSLCTFYRIW